MNSQYDSYLLSTWLVVKTKHQSLKTSIPENSTSFDQRHVALNGFPFLYRWIFLPSSWSNKYLFLKKKAFYISREPGTHKFGTSKIVHPKCAIGQLHDITFGTLGSRFFSGDPWGPFQMQHGYTWATWATWASTGPGKPWLGM